jgi:hypothetical protein
MGLVPYYSPPETVNLSVLTMDEKAASGELEHGLIKEY